MTASPVWMHSGGIDKSKYTELKVDTYLKIITELFRSY